MKTPIRTDFLHEHHVNALVNCETSHVRVMEYPDDSPISGTYEVVEPWAWTRADVLEAVDRYKDPANGQFETRAHVALQGKGQVVGGMVFEMLPDSFELLLLTVDLKMPLVDTETQHGRNSIRETLLEVLLRRTERSSKRTKIVAYVPDGNWELLQFFIKRSWSHKRVNNYYSDKTDAWLVTYDLAEK